jgi:hypothetical protein
MADNVAITAGAGTSIATDDIGGVQYQRVKITQGADGAAVDVSPAAPLTTTTLPATTGTITSPALSLTSFTVLASNTARLGATVFNDSSNTVYLALASAASVTSYTCQIASGGYYELPDSTSRYTGIITGIALVATGNLRVTELT